MHGAVRPSVVNTDNFQQIHAIPYDKRFVRGLADALILYMQLFAGKQYSDEPITTNVSPLDERQYSISITVKIRGKTEIYELVLSNQAAYVRDNLGQLAKVLHQFAEARQNAHVAKLNKRLDFASIKSQISEQISTFDYLDLLGALRDVQQKIANGESGARLFYCAGEIYSWLALFKNSNENRKLSDLLATKAVCNYLLGCLEEQTKLEKSFYEGLLLVALNYGAAAEEVLNPSQPIEQLLNAFIRYDFDQMRAMAKSPKINKRLQGYLLARAFHSSGQDHVANEQYVKLMMSYPDFLLAAEYFVRNAEVGMSRQHIEKYLEDLLEKHLLLVNELTNTQWMAQDRQLEQEVKKSVTGEKRLEKWFKLHGLIVSHSPQMKSTDCIVPGSFFSEFLMEDMSNAIIIWHHLVDKRLASRGEATKICEMVKTAYPNRPIVNILSFKQAEDRAAKEAFLKNFQVEEADKYILGDILYSGSLFGRQNIYYLKSYRDRENPDASGCFRLHAQYKALQYRSIAEMYLRNAMALNPYNYRFYEEMLKIDGGEEVIEKGRQNVGHLYGFLTAVAEYYRKNGEIAQAILHYEKAIEKGPAQQKAYYKPGLIYEEQKQYDKAIEIWKAYLKYDVNSLSAVEIQNAIGHFWLERGEYNKAYDVYLETQKSGQASAILGFAEASEKTGKVLQGEKNFQRAAQRYPRGRCPVKLGLFYLRQNNPEMAFQVFKEYKRYNWPGYYLEDLTDHCSQSGQPEKAIELVKAIEGQSNWPDFAKMLAVTYMKKNQYKLAADMAKAYATAGKRGSMEMENYWSSMVQGGLSTMAELSSKGIPPFHRDQFALQTLARYLVKNAHYDESVRVFSELLQKPNFLTGREGGDCLVQFSVAWSMGSRDENTREEILKLLKGAGMDPWVESKILFLLGELDEKSLMERAGSEDSQGQAQYWLGLMKFREGKKTEALQYMLMSLENMKEGQEYWHAKDVAKKLAAL